MTENKHVHFPTQVFSYIIYFIMNLQKSSKDMEGMILASLLQQINSNLPFFGSSTGADGIAKADVICFDLSRIVKSSVGETNTSEQ